MRVYTASNRRDDVVMVTTFGQGFPCRYVKATYSLTGESITRKQTASWFRYWRRCGWDIRRVI